MYDLTGNIALITGAAQGIGFGIASEFAKARCKVVIADVNLENGTTAATHIRKMGGEAIALPLDVTDADSVRSCVQEVIERYSRLDVLVNNAGIHSEKFGHVSTVEQFRRCFDVNLFGVWCITQAVVPHFKANGGGKIVNIASIAGHVPWADTAAYSASKAALINLTRSMAVKLGPDNINVNAICPGAVMTPMNEAFREDLPNMEEAQLAKQVFKRLLQPEDIGCAAVFFASPQAKNITGQHLNVDAGCVMF